MTLSRGWRNFQLIAIGFRAHPSLGFSRFLVGGQLVWKWDSVSRPSFHTSWHSLSWCSHEGNSSEWGSGLLCLHPPSFLPRGSPVMSLCSAGRKDESFEHAQGRVCPSMEVLNQHPSFLGWFASVEGANRTRGICDLQVVEWVEF